MSGGFMVTEEWMDCCLARKMFDSEHLTALVQGKPLPTIDDYIRIKKDIKENREKENGK